MKQAENNTLRRLVQEALWQAYYHNELNDLAKAVQDGAITSNDDSKLYNAAEAIVNRIEL